MFIAIDPAKLQDPTVITVIDSNYNIVNWMEMIGDNYNDQLSYIEALVSQYPNSIIGVDTLGPGEVLCDVLGQRLPKHSVMRYPMDSHHKSAMFIHLKDLIDNEKMSYPSDDCPEKNRFEGQMIELDAKWNGPLLQVKAPSGSTKHDDYPASLAIAVMMVQDNSLGDAFEFSVGTKTESRKINRRVNRYMRR
jgi:hypothetical protein